MPSTEKSRTHFIWRCLPVEADPDQVRRRKELDSF